MRTLDWGATGDDVASLQKSLRDLKLFDAQVDGVYTRRTGAAVKAWQRAHGRPADGVATPEIQQLIGGQQPAPGLGTGGIQRPAGGSGKVSLHIGLNAVHPDYYGGWSGPLEGCEADAATMRGIAEAEGYEPISLLTPDATRENVLGQIAEIAAALSAGDTFLLTYAGHGSQMPNPDGDDPEFDGQDETWCLYNGQCLDDEIDDALTGFSAGVKVVLLSDSCHSGTIYRFVPDTVDGAVPRERDFAALKEVFYTDLAVTRARGGPRPVFEAFPQPRAALGQIAGPGLMPEPLSALLLDVGGSSAIAGGSSTATQVRPTSQLTRTGGGASAGNGGAGSRVATRNMPFEVMIGLWKTQGPIFQQRRRQMNLRAPIAATCLSISGCADNQLSQEVDGAGVFTTTVHRLWADNTFSASYRAFHKAVVSQMGPTQTPQLGSFGPGAEEFADVENPF